MRDQQRHEVQRPIYDARTTEELSRIRTTALQAEVAANTRVAHAVLLDALLPMLRGYAPSHAVQLRSGPGIHQPRPTQDLNDLKMASPFDGVTALYAAVPDDAEARFSWLLSLDEDAITRLLAACAGALIDATEGKFTDRSRMACANRIARAVNFDKRQHWEGGHGFFDRLGKKALLEGLTEACGENAAENCAKMKRGAGGFRLRCARQRRRALSETSGSRSWTTLTARTKGIWNTARPMTTGNTPSRRSDLSGASPWRRPHPFAGLLPEQSATSAPPPSGRRLAHFPKVERSCACSLQVQARRG